MSSDHATTAAPTRHGATPSGGSARSHKGRWLSDTYEKNATLHATKHPDALDSTALAVLFAVAARAGDGNLATSYPSRGWLASVTGLSARSVDRALSRLRRGGWIVVARQGGTVKQGGTVIRTSTTYDLGDGPPLLRVVPSLDDTDATPDAPPPVTSDKGATVTGDKGPPVTSGEVNGSLEVGSSKEMNPESPRGSAAGTERSSVLNAPEISRDQTTAHKPRRGPASRKVDTHRIDEFDDLQEWVQHEWPTIDTPDQHAIENMWENGRNWRAIANYAEKITGYPHGGKIPMPPQPCQYRCRGGNIDGARDRRDGTLRPLPSGERPATWEDHCLIRCPDCR